MSAVEGTFCRSAPWRFVAEKAVLPWALSSQPLSGRVLEIGGGSGAMAAGVMRRFPHLDLTVTDMDPAMVAQARRRLPESVTVEVADVTALSYAEACFDVVASWLMLHHVVTWPDAVPEIARVLAPGGRFVGYDLTDTRVARLVHEVDGSPYAMVPPDALRAALEEAGFDDIELSRSAAGHLMRWSAVRS